VLIAEVGVQVGSTRRGSLGGASSAKREMWGPWDERWTCTGVPEAA
jgi:hypothetical protein